MFSLSIPPFTSVLGSLAAAIIISRRVFGGVVVLEYTCSGFANQGGYYHVLGIYLNHKPVRNISNDKLTCSKTKLKPKFSRKSQPRQEEEAG